MFPVSPETAVSARAALGTAVLVAGVAACGASKGGGPEALVEGTLGGNGDCVWVDAGENREEVVLPEGMSLTVDGDSVVLLDAQGQVVARDGDEVAFTGGSDDRRSPCTGEQGRPFVAWTLSPAG